MKGYLVLEDGNILEGELLYDLNTVGEVVFNTSMTGYQEILTDPSYYGQIVTLTYPLIGNYGINKEFNQSIKSHVKGFIVKNISDIDSNCKSEDTLQHFLKANNIPLLYDIDTRYLVTLIRERGVMRGAIVKDLDNVDNIKSKIFNYSIKDAVSNVTSNSIYKVSNGKYKIGLIDYGFKNNILKSLIDRDCTVTVFPASTKAEDILSEKIDGILLSNGPGDPADNIYNINEIKKLIGKKPIFGICLGHQLMALACGAKTTKLKYGHRGANHPVKDYINNKCYMTSQNHGYTVDINSISCDMDITHMNLNDNTVEGIKYKSHPTYTVQFHPEAHCGPQDAAYLFDDFLNTVGGK